MKTVTLTQIIPIADPANYKLHCAVWDKKRHPLDVFVDNREEWHGWNRHRPTNNDFNRKYILSLMQFYPESKDTWLFGGIYKVISDKGNIYQVELQDDSSEYIGRLKLGLKIRGRNRRPNLETYYDEIVVSELFKESYTGSIFCGYENVNLSFRDLELIYRNQKNDWKAALQNIKGVYLICDKKNGKKYVGSAYGDTGIWSRWAQYIETGHGKNKGLRELLSHDDKEYARQNFQFTLLELRSMRVDDKAIIEREGFWKDALLTRGEFGYNHN